MFVQFLFWIFFCVSFFLSYRNFKEYDRKILMTKDCTDILEKAVRYTALTVVLFIVCLLLI